MMRIREDMSLTGPDYFWLTPVTEQPMEGPTLAEAEGSSVTPRAWHTFQVNPWIDIYDLCSDLKPWLWGWSNTDPLSPILGYAHRGRFFLATDFPDAQMAYELSFKAGTVATMDGYSQRTADGMSYDLDYFWLTPV